MCHSKFIKPSIFVKRMLRSILDLTQKVPTSETNVWNLEACHLNISPKDTSKTAKGRSFRKRANRKLIAPWPKLMCNSFRTSWPLTLPPLSHPHFFSLNMVEEHATAACAHGPCSLCLITECLPFSPDILDYYYLSDISAPEQRVYKELIT